jgi:hypothetical protein
MPTTVLSAFAAFKSALEITDLQAQTVSTRQKNVRDAVAADFIELDDFLTGSYCRHTLIAPLKEADIDVFIVLAASYWDKDGYAKLLDSVKTTLKKTYPNSPSISRNGQAVTVTFSDFIVDVVPAFNRKGGGYLIPDTYGKRWIGTDPKKHVEMSTAQNKAHDGNLVRLIKMIKQWNKNISFPFRSFHLEVLAWSIFDGVTISSFPSGARYYFDKSRALIRKKNQDPAGYNGDVGSYLNSSNLDAAAGSFQTAYDRAMKAEAYAIDDKTSLAIDEWRKVFGTKFPAHG